MVCACASQYTEADLQGKLKIDSGDAIQRLTEQYHEAAHELSRTIPIGYNHLINIQQLLHSCYWFMSEARFIEFWHVLNLAIREAQELHIHQESKAEIVTEFELEIQRRVCQSSTLLGRPMLIDRSDCDVGLPSPSLEEARHSPLLHTRMQSSLVQHLFDRFGRTKNITDPTDIREYVGIIKKWTKDFLHPFDMHQTDQSLDWVAVHRHYVHIMAFSMLLNPIRPFFARAFTSLSLHTELTIRNDGISYCLEFMVSLRRFFNSVYPHVARFPFALLFIFDTAAGLCSAVLHDEHHTLPVREDVFRAIDDAHTMLRRLRMVTKSAETSYRILSRIMKRLSRTVEGQTCPRTAHPPKSTAPPGLSRLGECPWRTFYRPHASSLSVPEVSPLPTEWNVLGKSVDLEAYDIPLHTVR
ncbi:hypothetical protein NW767_014494 [Fusarium falciforme]|nr:hypothetical protein NW767_014494 [Fusarium falciforme]